MLPVPMLAFTTLLLASGCKKEAARPAPPPAEVGVVTVTPADGVSLLPVSSTARLLMVRLPEAPAPKL